MDAATLTVRLDPELWVFVAPRRRRAEFTAGHDGTASLGHVVEALGVPLTEVGVLRADGADVPPGHRPRSGAVVEVAAVARPQRVDGWSGAFVLDVHLGTLARRLRLLGVDTSYRNDASDDELVRHAGAERRLLLTRDRGLLKRRALWAGAYVRGDDPGEQLADVLGRFAPPLRPWTRCPACNSRLEPVPKADVAHLLEPGTRRTQQVFRRCGACGRVYWRGAHGPRLAAIVDAARAGGDAPRDP
ncbi:MAG TPA: Mut7-C RNAse domain-containing protein [Pseudonocardia sp.]|nr:Mut7-C RNAse domain-containing protein [Pseudonocardia sp.]